MNKPTNQEANIQQSPMDDLTINEDHAAAIKGGPVAHSNTYTGVTTVAAGTLVL